MAKNKQIQRARARREAVAGLREIYGDPETMLAKNKIEQAFPDPQQRLNYIQALLEIL